MADPIDNVGSGIGKVFKSIPTPAIIIGGGAVLGLGYAVYRDRKNKAAVVDTAAVDGQAPYGSSADYSQYLGASGGGIPGGVVVTGSGPPDSSAETVGAVGQTALEQLGLLWSQTLPTLIEAVAGQQQTVGATVAEIIGALPQAQPPQSQSTGTPPAPAPTPAQPTTAPPPPNTDVRASEPSTTQQTKDTSVRGRTFPNMTGYSAGGVGKNGGKEYRSYRIFFKSGAPQLWNYYPADNRWVQR